MLSSLLLPGTLPTWKGLSWKNPWVSYRSSIPLLRLAPGFGRDMPQGCESPLLGGLLPAHRAPQCWNSAASGFKADFLHPQPLYPIHSYKGVPAVLQVSAKPKDVSQQLIALICTERRVQPTLGHATSWLGWGG